jgi:competence protein ComEC
MGSAATVPLRDHLNRAPLVPVALAATIGIVADRYLAIPWLASLIGAIISLAGWAVTQAGPRSGLGVVYLLLAVVALGALDHHCHVDVYPQDDLGLLATEEPRLARVRGVLDEEPAIMPAGPVDALQTLPRGEQTLSVVRVHQLQQGHDWLTVSGRVRLIVAGRLEGMHVGDAVEIAGRLSTPSRPANPGEADVAANLRDQRIRAMLVVVKTADAVTRIEIGWPSSLFGWLGVARGWGQRQLQEHLPPGQAALAGALLLGEGSPMSRADWDRYVRTGVLHVLAISGQHLVVLAGFLWLGLRLVDVRQRQGAVLVVLVLTAYALLVGFRPPVLRAAIMVGAVGGSLVLRRRVIPVNIFALAWLAVAILNPADLFNTGCQLSFLAVAVLMGLPRLARTRDPLEALIDATRPAWLRSLRRLARAVSEVYLVSALVWLAISPLVAARYHLVSPVALLLGPPLTLLTSVALIAGFLLLFASFLWWPLALIPAWLTRWSLHGCDVLVDIGDWLPLGHWYVADIPNWWLWGCYALLFAALFLRAAPWQLLVPGALAWISVGMIAVGHRPRPDELRCTFLAVGHGGCTVIETPDGRVLLYDTGAMAGPDLTRRQVAPFLWQRGIRRIDEVFLSHADLDHYNGVPSLLERFAVSQVTLTPSFADKPTAAVRLVIATLFARGVPLRVVQAGDRLTAGDVAIDVLHPPAQGPEGNENARSLVLRLQHAGHALLLTGDLEGPGLEQVLRQPAAAIDILMSPHHGSRLANTPGLAAWSRPRVVIACQGRPRWPTRERNPYEERGAIVFGTWPHGAVTVRSRAGDLRVETFKTGERIELP